MITIPAGWTERAGANVLTLIPPAPSAEAGALSGRQLAEIRYYERFGPLRRCRQVVEALLRSNPELSHTGPLPTPERVVTAEGEYGARLCVPGQARGAIAPVEIWCGAVFAEDFTSALLGIVRQPEQVPAFATTFRQVLVGMTIGLGRRPRRYLYVPPPGWQALASGVVANWYPPDYPSERSVMVVYPGNPVDEDPAAVWAAVLAEECAAGLVVATEQEPQSVSTRCGLQGQLWQVSGAHVGQPFWHRSLAILQHGRHLYSLRLDCCVAELLPVHQALFLEVVQSVQGLPEAPAQVPAGGLVAHWAD